MWLGQEVLKLRLILMWKYKRYIYTCYYSESASENVDGVCCNESESKGTITAHYSNDDEVDLTWEWTSRNGVALRININTSSQRTEWWNEMNWHASCEMTVDRKWQQHTARLMATRMSHKMVPLKKTITPIAVFRSLYKVVEMVYRNLATDAPRIYENTGCCKH